MPLTCDDEVRHPLHGFFQGHAERAGRRSARDPTRGAGGGAGEVTDGRPAGRAQCAPGHSPESVW
jgi:hypothetical protein